MTCFSTETLQLHRLLSRILRQAIAPPPLEGTVLTNPHSLWSLWVPFLLLLTIVGAAVYFARVRIR